MTGNVERRVFPDAQALSAEGADRFVRLAAEAIAARGRFDVALSGGSTPRTMHRLLAQPPRRDAVDWSRVHLWWGDDRHVPPDDDQSNYRMARETLIEQVPIPPGNVHRMETELPAEECAARYEALLREHLAGTWPVLDLIYLGMGPDGHTASLFPETAALNETRRWVVANWVPKLETWRITLSPPALNAARHVVFLIAGPDKAAALSAVLQGPRDTHRYPAQMIHPPHGTLTYLLDQAAAAGLKP